MENCTFCGTKLTPGTGKMYVQKDSRILWFCSRRCEKNLLKLGRTPRNTKFTVEARKIKVAAKVTAQHAADVKAGKIEAPVATTKATPKAKSAAKPKAPKAAPTEE